VLFCSVYYLKATFGLGTGDAVLEIPLSITDSGLCLTFFYQISSSSIELAVYQSNADKTELSRIDVLKYTDQKSIGRWNYGEFALDSDARAVQLVAMKTGVTTSVEYVLVDVVEIDKCFIYGNVLANISSVCQEIIHLFTTCAMLAKYKLKNIK